MEISVSQDAPQSAAERIGRRLRDSVRRRGTASLALSGGSTAPPMIAALASIDLPWHSIGVWQVDERVAPDGHEARNAVQLAPLHRASVHPMPVTARDLRAAARRYASGLPERFDVVHLGVGDDGHTASWPPGVASVRDSQRPVEVVDEFNGWPRMTLTRRVVNAARLRVVLTTGADKRSAVERWLLEDPAVPVSAVRRTGTWLFLDPDAAPAAPLHAPQ